MPRPGEGGFTQAKPKTVPLGPAGYRGVTPLGGQDEEHPWGRPDTPSRLLFWGSWCPFTVAGDWGFPTSAPLLGPAPRHLRQHPCRGPAFLPQRHLLREARGSLRTQNWRCWTKGKEQRAKRHPRETTAGEPEGRGALVTGEEELSEAGGEPSLSPVSRLFRHVLETPPSPTQAGKIRARCLQPDTHASGARACAGQDSHRWHNSVSPPVTLSTGHSARRSGHDWGPVCPDPDVATPAAVVFIPGCLFSLLIYSLRLPFGHSRGHHSHLRCVFPLCFMGYPQPGCLLAPSEGRSINKSLCFGVGPL